MSGPTSTVELIVDESDWTASIPIAVGGSAPVPTESPTETAIETPAGAPKQPYGEPSVAKLDLVDLRVGFNEVDLRQKVKAVGAKWDPGRRLWMLRRDRAIGSVCRSGSPHRRANKKFMLFDACI